MRQLRPSHAKYSVREACQKDVNLTVLSRVTMLSSVRNDESYLGPTWHPDVVLLVEVDLVLGPADGRLEGGQRVRAALGGLAAAQGANVDS